MRLDVFLDEACAALRAQGIVSARLDAQLLTARVLGHDRTWLLAYGDQLLDASELAKLQKSLDRRLQREPLAYILGHRAFYGRDFIVSPEVLIPRPETEVLIDELKQLRPASMLDVGTGSGAIAITAKLELPETAVRACDISAKALAIARQNARNLDANVQFFASDLLEANEETFAVIAANLPYVDETWERSPETNHEPPLALFAADRGLALIKKLITQVPNHLEPRGHLLLEADPAQHKAIISFAKSYHLSPVVARDYVVTLQLTG